MLKLNVENTYIHIFFETKTKKNEQKTTTKKPTTTQQLKKGLALVAQLDAHPNGDQEVVGLTRSVLATFFRGD